MNNNDCLLDITLWEQGKHLFLMAVSRGDTLQLIANDQWPVLSNCQLNTGLVKVP